MQLLKSLGFIRMIMKKLIGYVRVSSEVSKNKGNSIINQINKVNEFCKYNEFELIDVLKDEGKVEWSIVKEMVI